MEELKTYYRAFREYREKMAGNPAHQALLKALAADSNAAEGFQGKLSCCIWDDEWINAMLDALPYVEKALAEQRKFIISNEEIRRIDQAKKISVESIRHLAQHSNMISEVHGDDIIPDRVLIAERDDNYAIYENRFLYTLVQRMHSFLDERYRAVAELNDAKVHSFQMKRSATWNRKHIEANIQLRFEQRAEKNRIDIDVSEMNSMERVNYLRSRVADLANLPLMRLLKGTTLVTSPVVRTNVFKKNTNFKCALELFEYLENYRKSGFEIVLDAPEEDKLDPEFRDELIEAVALENFIGRMNTDAGLRTELEDNFIRENELLEQERIRREKERERIVQRRIEEARQIEIEIREREVALRDGIIDQKNDEVLKLQIDISELKDAFEAAKESHAAQIADQKVLHSKQISELKRQQEAALSEANARMAKMQAEFEASMAASKREYDAELKCQKQSIVQEYKQFLFAERENNLKKLKQLEESWSARLDAQRAEYERRYKKALARHRKDAEAELDDIRKALEKSEEKAALLAEKLERLKSQSGFSLKRLIRK